MRMSREEIAEYELLQRRLPGQMLDHWIESSQLDEHAYTFPGLLFHLWDEKAAYILMRSEDDYYQYIRDILAKMPDRMLNEGVYYGKTILLHALDRADMDPKVLDMILAVTSNEGVNAVFTVDEKQISALSLGLEKGVMLQHWVKLVRQPLYEAYPSLQLAVDVIKERRVNQYFDTPYIKDCHLWLNQKLEASVVFKYRAMEILYKCMSIVNMSKKIVENAIRPASLDEIHGVKEDGYDEDFDGVLPEKASHPLFAWQLNKL